MIFSLYVRLFSPVLLVATLTDVRPAVELTASEAVGRVTSCRGLD